MILKPRQQERQTVQGLQDTQGSQKIALGFGGELKTNSLQEHM